MDSIDSASHWSKVMHDENSVEKHLDYLLKRAMIEMDDYAKAKDGLRAVVQAMYFMADYMKNYQREMHNAQAHQRCKAKRQEERLAESEKAAQDACEGRCEDGQEAGKVQIETYIKLRELRVDAKQLFLDVWNLYGRTNQTIPFVDGEVRIIFK